MQEDELLSGVEVEGVLKRALERGGELADLFAEEKSSTLIEVEDQRVERLIQGRRSGSGVRVIHDHRTSYSFADLINKSSLTECAQTASTAIKKGGEQKPVPVGKGWSAHLLPAKTPPREKDVSCKLDLVWKAEAAARKADPRIVQVRVLYMDQVRRTAVADSQGLMASDNVTYILLYVIAIAGDHSGIQMAHESLGGTGGLEVFNERGPEEVASAAASRALQNLDARPAPAGSMPVVLASEAGGTMIHEAVGHGLEADLAEQGMSVYAGKAGQQVASPLVTVLDDATVPGWRGSFSIDDEGTPAQKTVLVEEGVLKGYMYDRRLAAKTGKKSTGNGRRESYAHPPIVRMTNTMIAPGSTDPGGIVRSVDKGLLVKRMGGGEVNTVNGDFVFEVEEGHLIEKGEQGDPVRGATLTGNGPRVLMEIDMVGNDLGTAIGTCGKDGQGVPVADAQPTVRIPEIVVGGRIVKD